MKFHDLFRQANGVLSLPCIANPCFTSAFNRLTVPSKYPGSKEGLGHVQLSDLKNNKIVRMLPLTLQTSTVMTS
jgi:hypothetical protein